MKPRVALALIAGTLATTCLAACSTASSSPSPSASAAAAGGGTGTSGALTQYTAIPTALPVTSPLSKKPPVGVKVVFLQNGQTPGEQFSAALQGAVKILGWTEQDVNFDAANPASIGSAFQIAVNGGAKVIVVQGLDAALYSKFVPAARAKHIVVVDTVSSGTTIPGVTYVDRSDSEGKPVAAIAVAAIMADAKTRHITPHVLTVSSVLFTSLLTPTIDDIAADVKSAACGACSSNVFDLSAQATISNAVAAPVVSYLQSHRDINYLFTPNGSLSTGLLSAVQQAGLGTSIRLVGATPLPAQIAELKTGNPQNLGWIADSIVVVAWMSVDAAARVLVGDDAAMYAHVAAPTWLLTNDSGSELVPDPVAPTDYASKFAALWHAAK
jgi:ABC-type sugar transport system substrate-binding protein